jgi:alkylation response protein AidB-like acyl-CoA dehydrogenase
VSQAPPDVSDATVLARSLDEALEKILSIETLLESAAADRHLPNEATADLVGLGWAGVAVAEEGGGLGLGAATQARLAAVAGRRLVPVAMRGEAFLLAPLLAALARGGSGVARSRLDALLAGELRGGGAVGEAKTFTCALAPGAAVAALATGDWAAVVDLERDPVDVTAFEALDRGQGTVRMTLRGELPDERVLQGDEVATIVRGWTLAALAEAYGAGRQALELATAYARERNQFGKPIASFQAVSHALAGSAVGLEGAAAGIGKAVAGDDVDELVGVLRYVVPAAARTACESSIQVHGGMGFTWELGLHLLYRRVLEIQYALGGEARAARAAGAAYLGRTGK